MRHSLSSIINFTGVLIRRPRRTRHRREIYPRRIIKQDGHCCAGSICDVVHIYRQKMTRCVYDQSPPLSPANPSISSGVVQSHRGLYSASDTGVDGVSRGYCYGPTRNALVSESWPFQRNGCKFTKGWTFLSSVVPISLTPRACSSHRISALETEESSRASRPTLTSHYEPIRKMVIT